MPRNLVDSRMHRGSLRFHDCRLTPDAKYRYKHPTRRSANERLPHSLGEVKLGVQICGIDLQPTR
jgi:hypothetical protein